MDTAGPAARSDACSRDQWHLVDGRSLARRPVDVQGRLDRRPAAALADAGDAAAGGALAGAGSVELVGRGRRPLRDHVLAPLVGVVRPVGRADPRWPGSRGTACRRRCRRPGRRLDDRRRDDAPRAAMDRVRHERRVDRPQDVQVGERSNSGQPASPCQVGRRSGRADPVGLDRRGDVSGPTQVMRAGRAGPRRAVDIGLGELVARSIWPTGPAATGAGRRCDGLGADERAGHRAIESGDRTSDGQGATGPGDVGEAPDRGWPSASVEGALGGRGQDHGGDGHRPAPA